MSNLTLGELKLICAKATVENISDDCEVYFDFEKVEMFVNEKDFNVAIQCDELDCDSDRIVKAINHSAILSDFDEFVKESEESIILKFKSIIV